MGEVAAGAAASSRCQHWYPAISGGGGSVNCDLKPIMGRCIQLKTTAVWPPAMRSKTRNSSAIPAMNSGATHSSDVVTYSSNVSTDVPLYEPPGVSFDEYLSDRPRIFRAMFPDQRRSERLNDEEWQIQMLPLHFLLATVRPVVVMRLRCKSDGREYPRLVPRNVKRVLELQATRWELQGLDALHMPPHFSLSVQGLLYSEQRGSTRHPQAHLRGHLELSISLVLPTLLALVPEDVRRSTAELVLKTLVERMKQEVHRGLLSDFRSFGREKLMKHKQAALTSSGDGCSDSLIQGDVL